MLELNPHNRITAEQALEHSYFTEEIPQKPSFFRLWIGKHYEYEPTIHTLNSANES
jgi:hypothetical protein